MKIHGDAVKNYNTRLHALFLRFVGLGTGESHRQSAEMYA